MNQSNTYSEAVRRLLPTIPNTFGADISLSMLSKINLVKRVQLKGINVLVAQKDIQKGHAICQVEGHVALESEINRKPGENGGIFRYENLMKGNGKPIICIEIIEIANFRRSCKPNAVIKHIMSSGKILNFFLIATRDIPFFHEITLSFESDWLQSEYPLYCTGPHFIEEMCPMLLREYVTERLEDSDDRFHNMYGLDSSSLAILSKEPPNMMTDKKRRRFEKMFSDVALQYQHQQQKQKELEYPKFTQQDYQIIDILAKRSRNIHHPLILNELYTEISEKTGAPFNSLFVRIRHEIIPQIHKLNCYDTDTKIRILFATSTPINSLFLEELRKQAKVCIDDQRHITYYESTKSRLKLEGLHGFETKMTWKNQKLPIDDSCDHEISEPIKIKQEVDSFHEYDASTSSRIPQVVVKTEPEVEKYCENLDDMDFEDLILTPEEEHFKSQDAEQRTLEQEEQSESVMNYFEEKEDGVQYVYDKDSSHTSSEAVKLEDQTDDGNDESTEIMLTGFKSIEESTETRNDDEHEMRLIEKIEKEEPGYPKFDQKDYEIIDFLAERTRNVEYPMVMRQLYLEITEKTGVTSNSLYVRIRHKIAPKIYKLNCYDNETKVRILFATSTPIDAFFLEELRKQATVDIDKKGRITFYESAKSGLKLTGLRGSGSKKKWTQPMEITPKPVELIEIKQEVDCFHEYDASTSLDNPRVIVKTEPEYEHVMCTFMKVEQSSKSSEEMDFKDLILTPEEECRKRKESEQLMVAIEREKQLEYVKDRLEDSDDLIHGMHDLNQPQTSSEPITSEVQECEDDMNLLQKQIREELGCPKFTQQDYEIIDFLAERTRNIEYPLILNELYAEIAQKTGALASSIRYRLRNEITCRIHKLNLYDIETRVRIIFATSTPIDAFFMAKLQEKATVELDQKRRITLYESAENGLKLTGLHNSKAKKIWSMENKKMSEEVVSEIQFPVVGTRKRRRIDNELELTPKRVEFIKIKEEMDDYYQYNTPESTVIPQIIVKTEPEDEEFTFYSPNELAKNEPSTSSLSNFQHVEKLSLTIFAQLTENLIIALENPLYNNLRQRIRNIIKNVGYSNENIPIDNIQCVLETTFSMITKNFYSTSPESSPESTTSLEEFLNHLKIMIIELRSAHFNGLLEQVNARIQNLEVNDEMISNDIIRLAIECIVNSIS